MKFQLATQPFPFLCGNIVDYGHKDNINFILSSLEPTACTDDESIIIFCYPWNWLYALMMKLTICVIIFKADYMLLPFLSWKSISWLRNTFSLTSKSWLCCKQLQLNLKKGISMMRITAQVSESLSGSVTESKLSSALFV